MPLANLNTLIRQTATDVFKPNPVSIPPYRILALGVVVVLYSSCGAAQAPTSLYIPPIREVMDNANKDFPDGQGDSWAGQGNSSASSIGKASDPAASFYMQAVADKIERMPGAWPKDELGRDVYGEVAVLLTIGSDGSLLKVATRGERTLASMVVDRAKRAAPFLPPPKSMLRNENSVQFSRTFAFRRETIRQPVRAKPSLPFMPGPGPVIRVR